MMNSKDARRAASRALDLAEEAKDPAEVKNRQIKQRQRERSDTVRKLVADYMADPDQQRLAKAVELGRKLERHVVAAWGNRSIHDISERDVAELIDGIRRKSGPGAAEEIYRRVRRLFNWAMEKHRVQRTPVVGYKPPPIGARDRVLTHEEVRLVWEAADRLGYPYGPLYQMLLLTGQRRAEIASARWDWIRVTEILRGPPENRERQAIPVLEVPAENFKGKRVNVVPLSGPALELLESLPRFHGPYIFTTTDGEKPVSGYAKGKRRLDDAVLAVLRETEIEAEPLPHWVVHDLRRTMRTNLADLGVNAIVANLCIGHKIKGLDAVYDRHSYLLEKLEAMEAWADRIQEIVGGSFRSEN